MKVCLINPKTDMLINDAVMPPLGLWYVSAAIQDAGHEVVISDMVFDDPIPNDADAYGITGTSPQVGRMRKLVERIRALNPSALIMAGGTHATLEYEEMWDYGVDMVIRGEAEEIIGAALADPACTISSPHRIDDLDSLPFPDRRQVHRYHYEINGLPATSIITSRGCPYRCAFCCKPLKGGVRMRSVGNIVQEVRSIRDDYGFGALMFYDDTLGIHKARLIKLCEEMGGTGIIWRCLLRGEQATDEIAQALRVGGCVEVGVGVESGSDTILENIHKGETVDEIEQGIRALRRADIRVKGLFIIGLPGESRETLAETEAFLERVPLDDVDFTIFSVYPGSPIYDNPAEYDVFWRSTKGYYKADPSKYVCAVRTFALTARELLEARKHLESKFKRWR